MKKEQLLQKEPTNDLIANDLTLDQTLDEKSPDNLRTFDKLPKELRYRIANDPALSPQDRRHLTHSCKGFYEVLHAELLKPKAYSFGVIPHGLLDDPIFRKYPLNYHVLIDILQRYRLRPESNFKLPYLDDQLVWPLVALTGMIDALEVLVADNPRQKDLNDLTPLYFIVLGGHLDCAVQWINKYYPEFSLNDEPQLLLAAMASGNETLVRVCINDYHYPLNFGIEAPAYNETFGWRCLEFGYRALFWEIVAPTIEKYIHREYLQTYPAYAALFGHWKLFDEIMEKGFASTRELRQILVQAAARDDKNRFLELIKEFEDERLRDNDDFDDDDEINPGSEEYELFQNFITLKGAAVFACKGGNIETLEYLCKLDMIIFDSFNSQYWDVQAPNKGILTLRWADFAAMCGQIELIKHFINVHNYNNYDPNWAEWIFYFATMYGDWDKFMQLINLYRKGSYDDFFVFYVPGGLSHRLLDPAIESGNLYFVQRLLTPSNIRYFAFIEENGMLEKAEESKNRALLRFVKGQIEQGKKAQKEYLLEQALAEAAKREEERRIMEEWRGEPEEDNDEQNRAAYE